MMSDHSGFESTPHRILPSSEVRPVEHGSKRAAHPCPRIRKVTHHIPASRDAGKAHLSADEESWQERVRT